MAGGLQVSADVWMSSDFGVTWLLMPQTPATPGPYNNVMSYQGAQQNCMSLRYFSNANSPGGYHKQLTLYGSANYITVAQQSAPECVTQSSVNVLYGEILFASESSNSNFQDTSVVQAPANTVPSLNLNGPSSLMPQRWYPDCGYDVHAAIRGTSPMSYAMGGHRPQLHRPTHPGPLQRLVHQHIPDRLSGHEQRLCSQQPEPMGGRCGSVE